MTSAGSPSERAIDPDVPVVDAHHHLWVRDSSRYLLPEFLADVNSGHRVAASVFVEGGAMYRQHGPPALRSAGEVEFAADVAAQTQAAGREFCGAIVSRADLRLGAGVEELLLAQMEAGAGRLRGVRQPAAWDRDHSFQMSKDPAPQGLLSDATFRSGLAVVQRLGLSFELYVYHPQLAEVADLARSFRDLSVVVAHAGGPVGVGAYAERASAFRMWRQGMAELSRCENVMVKLSGLGMPICGFGFDRRSSPASSAELAEAWRPYIESCIELFGPGRCMAGSNAPVDRPSGSYVVLWNALKRSTATLTSDERRQVLATTAARFYGLPIH